MANKIKSDADIRKNHVSASSLDTNNSQIKAHLCALFTTNIWSTTYISIKVLLNDFSPIEILFFRFFIAYIVLLIASPHIIKYKNKKEELLFAAAGLCGVTLYFTLQNTALVYTVASNFGVLVSVAPFFTTLLSFIVFKGEPLRRRFFLGFIVTIIGIFLICFNGNFVLQLNPIGDIMAILCAGVWAVYSVIMKKISAFNYNVIQCTRKIFFYGLVFLLPILPFTSFHLDIGRFASASNLLNMLYLALGASAICFVTWNYALGVLGPVKTTIYIYLSPIITIITSAIILREQITSVAVAGVILILAGLYISEKKSVKKSKSNIETQKI